MAASLSEWELVDEDFTPPPHGTQVLWERVDDLDDAASALDISSTALPTDTGSGRVATSFPRPSEVTVEPRLKQRPLSIHSKEGREARAFLEGLSIRELRDRLGSLGKTSDGVFTRASLAEELLGSVGVEQVLGEARGLPQGSALDAPPLTPTTRSGCTGPPSVDNSAGRGGLDYSRFHSIDYEKEYGLDGSEDEVDFAPRREMADPKGSGAEGVDLFRVLCSELPAEERGRALESAMRAFEQGARLKPPPPPPPPECNPMVYCTPDCDVDVVSHSWLDPSGPWPSPDAGEPEGWEERGDEPAELRGLGSPRSDTGGGAALEERGAEGAEADAQREHGGSAELRPAAAADAAAPGQDSPQDLVGGGRPEDAPREAAADEAEPAPRAPPAEDAAAAPGPGGDWPEAARGAPASAASAEAPAPVDEALSRMAEACAAERRGLESRAHVLEGVDIDGWGLESSQLDLVEEADEDLTELRVLLKCSEREANRDRLHRAFEEFRLKLRMRRTWAWFPLTRYEWSGFEYGQPRITLDFRVPGAGGLPPGDVHCDFGTDWFDLKVWNVSWPEDPGTRYHHRVRKTRLMRDIVPSECSVKAKGDHVYVYLQKVSEPRHGYCAWPELAAGKGRKPFRYNEDAPDGGLMDFFEGEYEKHEGYDGFRRDIGKAMEKVHRGEPVRGIPDTPLEDD